MGVGKATEGEGATVSQKSIQPTRTLERLLVV